MPRSTREWGKRKLLMCVGNLDTCDGHLQEVGQKYLEHHPSITATIITIMEANKVVRDLLIQLEASI